MAFDAGPIVGVVLGILGALLIMALTYSCYRRRRL